MILILFVYDLNLFLESIARKVRHKVNRYYSTKRSLSCSILLWTLPKYLSGLSRFPRFS